MPGNCATRRDAYITSGPEFQAVMPAHDHAVSAAVETFCIQIWPGVHTSREHTI